MRDWSSMRIEGSRSVAAFDQALVEVKDRAVVVEGAAALQRQAPVTAAMQLAACMLAAPLREREKP